MVQRACRAQTAVAQLHRLPVTPRERTALDCLGQLNWEAALALWAWLLSRQILSPEILAAAVRERFAQHGNATLLQLLRLAGSGAASVAEQKLHRLLRSAGLIGWQANVQIQDESGLIAVVDLLFPEAKLVIEVDGFATHDGQKRFIADRRRQNRLLVAGYLVFRVTWADLTDRATELIAEIRTMLDRLGRLDPRN